MQRSNLQSDGKDLNRLFPGKSDGTASQIYAHNVMEKIVNSFNYLIDLHTASFGRVNSYYVRADMNDVITASLARLVGQLAGGGLAIPVSHRVPLDRWKEGWAALAERRAVGKVVVVCGGGGGRGSSSRL